MTRGLSGHKFVAHVNIESRESFKFQLYSKKTTELISAARNSDDNIFALLFCSLFTR